MRQVPCLEQNPMGTIVQDSETTGDLLTLLPMSYSQHPVTLLAGSSPFTRKLRAKFCDEMS